MIHPGPGEKIFVATKHVDFRKGHDGLAALVQNHLREKPFDGAVYVYRDKPADRLKLIFWDRSDASDELQAAGAEPVQMAAGHGWRRAARSGAVRGAFCRARRAAGKGPGYPATGCGRMNQGVHSGVAGLCVLLLRSHGFAR